LISLIFIKIALNCINVLAGIAHKYSSRRDTKFEDSLMPIIRVTLKIIILIAGGLYILNGLKINITPLVAGVSIVGLAIGLAAQETIRNLFGSVSILTDQPFEVGDYIRFDNYDGTVEKIGVRSSRIRTLNNSLITVPNGKFADTTIDNFGKRRYRRFMTTISLTYDTHTEKIELFIAGLRHLVAGYKQVNHELTQIYLNDLSESSLNIFFNIYFQVQNIKEELKEREDVIMDIIRLAEKLGINFAFPSRTLYIEKGIV